MAEYVSDAEYERIRNDSRVEMAAATDIYGADRAKLYESGLSSVCGSDAVDALFSVQTFYEKQYLAQGLPITYLSFVIDHDGPYVSPDWGPDRWPR